MPNFKAKKLKELNFPFHKDGVSFLYKAENERVILILTQCLEQSFFLQIKKDKNEYLIKADKHSRPSKIGYLQKALQIFMEHFCEGVYSKAFALKNNALTEPTPLIAKDFETLLKSLDNRDKIFIEIGFGSGRHLLFQAKENPKILMLGVEIYTPAITQVAKLARVQNLENIILIQSDARLLLSVLKAHSVAKIFLHFPVPWEDSPHRRVVSEDFCKECARVLESEGSFELRTDSLEYFDFTLKEFLKFKHSCFSFQKNHNLEISSKYEDRWKKQEKDIYNLMVWNLDKEEKESVVGDFDLEKWHLSEKDLEKFCEKFKHKSFKGEDYFLHCENLYTSKKGVLLKLAFGSFNSPQHSYLLLNENVSFVLKPPFKTKENLKAFKKLREILIENKIS